MQYNMGIDRTKLVRDASMAVRALDALTASSAGTRPNARFWFGQMIIQTFAAMMIASHMPTPMTRKFSWKVSASTE